MKIFDCFMYFDEEIVLDVRLNTLNEFVDYFVIVESKFTHKGDQRDLKFNIKKFERFKDKIIYLVFDDSPKEVELIKYGDNDHEKSKKYIYNAILRENGQRNYIKKGLVDAEENDIIIISDVDEIPNLQNINFDKINEKIILFKQDMFYYKFNLHLPNLVWTGTKACRKKNLLSPQWLRNIKDRKYSFYRLDTLFSKTKYQNIKYIDNGGWHFTNIKTAKEIEHKLKSYLHHREFDVNPLNINQIDEIIKSKKAIYNLNVDKSVSKIGNGNELKKFDPSKLPNYIQKNKNQFKEWMED
jgi:beta-1,4-mannosyl-glycoprotein beta-1,4-N-acetylglucosaminyltransferase